MQTWRWVTSEITIASLQLCSPFPGPSTFTRLCSCWWMMNRDKRPSCMQDERRRNETVLLNLLSDSTDDTCYTDEMKSTQLCTQHTAEWWSLINVFKKNTGDFWHPTRQQKFPHHQLQICWNVAECRQQVLSRAATLQMPSIFQVAWTTSKDTGYTTRDDRMGRGSRGDRMMPEGQRTVIWVL